MWRIYNASDIRNEHPSFSSSCTQVSLPSQQTLLTILTLFIVADRTLRVTLDTQKALAREAISYAFDCKENSEFNFCCVAIHDQQLLGDNIGQKTREVSQGVP